MLPFAVVHDALDDRLRFHVLERTLFTEIFFLSYFLDFVYKSREIRWFGFLPFFLFFFFQSFFNRD